MRRFYQIFQLILIGSYSGSSAGEARKPYDFNASEKLIAIVEPFIVGGETVEGREYPGQVSLQFGEFHNCGGSIVNSEWILTAAHCSGLPVHYLTVLSGTNLLSVGGTRHNVSNVVVHELYNPKDSWINDIAVIQVNPPFEFGNGTDPVKLVESQQEPSVGSIATVIGWGRLSEKGPPSDELRKVNILISNRTECDDVYFNEFQLHVYETQICASVPAGNKGSCNGDSGGPLFVNGEVVGLVSWAEGCAEPGYPTVYTNIADYRDWVESKTGV